VQQAMRRYREQIIVTGALKAVATPRAVVLEQNLSLLPFARSLHLQSSSMKFRFQLLPSNTRTAAQSASLRDIGFGFVKPSF
jgi:hypothetical protein